MGSKILLDLIYVPQSRNSACEHISWNGAGSYIDAMYRILVHKQWTDLPRHMIAGMTANVFRLVVDRRLTTESISAYNWMAENFVAADFIGVTASQSAGFSFEPTFPLYQKQALLAIKASIDRGVGAILWHDQFVICTGYDDGEQVLFICESKGNEVIRLPYDSFGRNSTPYWYYQVLESHTTVDVWELCKESLIQAVYKWETHDYMLPPQDYACGPAAYAAIAAALQSGIYETDQAAKVLRYYANSRQDMAVYVAELGHLSNQMNHVVQEYALLADLYAQMMEKVEDSAAWDAKEPGHVLRVINLIKQARETEQRAIDAIKQAFPETIGNRFEDIGLR
ncbi:MULTISPECIES: hypothetical protein [unclassified Paenibacillus]|uniref:hypothetical protein n=1 Tax=unclassified Paenibacillus TaxID=185978 RepID=UPI0003F54739|nr:MULTISPECIES: hypothetical protein [unclassified Paenibacillus]KGP81293.1 hypothetical protein P364_0117385 [Paenibacillus sp. MAEPY2]KGP87546.1 hypothetical protein P363_0110790 [Paenibacillus sp. MAEPY1]